MDKENTNGYRYYFDKSIERLWEQIEKQNEFFLTRLDKIENKIETELQELKDIYFEQSKLVNNIKTAQTVSARIWQYIINLIIGILGVLAGLYSYHK